MNLFDVHIKEAFIKIRAENDSAEPDEPFDSPDFSKWIVAIDEEGNVHVLSKPNIHYTFYDNGNSAEEIGLPYETDNPPGVYEWICSFNQTTDWESGHVDGWSFDVEEEKLLWTWVDNGEANKATDEKTQPDS